ncbi:zinc ribbon domain-containing protein [Methanoregula sp.]|uniref:zinc ribbon domain-containing protein n=2 Tax=Methanoregula sp. TaxID=2052170 RepID=UPI003BAF09A7
MDQSPLKNTGMHEICPHCGKESNEDAPRFCSGCGARMDGKTPAGYPGYSAPVREQKNRLIAGACSSVLPGLGQVYNGETAKGFAIFILTLAGLALLLIPGLIAWLYGIYNAYTTAGKMNTGEIPFRETRMLHVVLFIVFAVAVIAVTLLVLIYLVIDPLMSQMGTLDTGSFNQLLGSGGSI